MIFITTKFPEKNLLILNVKIPKIFSLSVFFLFFNLIELVVKLDKFKITFSCYDSTFVSSFNNCTVINSLSCRYAQGVFRRWRRRNCQHMLSETGGQSLAFLLMKKRSPELMYPTSIFSKIIKIRIENLWFLSVIVCLLKAIFPPMKDIFI